MHKLYIIFLVVLCGCMGSEDYNDGRSHEVKINIFKDSFGEAKIKKVIQLESGTDAFLGRVARILINENRIYILDGNRNKMMVFNGSGHHLHTITSGKGPGELIDPTDFEFNPSNETILIWDHQGKKLECCDRNLNHVDTKLMKSDLLAPWFIQIPNNQFLTFNGTVLTPNGDEYYTYVLRMENMEIIRGLLSFDKSLLTSMLTYNPFSRESKKSILFYKPRDNNIYTYNFEREDVVIKYKIDFGPYNIQEENKVSIVELLKSGKIVLIIGDIINSSNYFAASTTYKQRQEYFLYQKKSGKVRFSLAVNDLPYGVLKGMTDDESFILVVDPKDYLEFIRENKRTDLPHIEGLKDSDNYILIIFTIDSNEK